MKLPLLLALATVLLTQPMHAMVCKRETSDVAPFYVSDEYRQGDKVWENLRALEDDSKKKYYLPRGSIVYSPPELYEFEPDNTARVPIEVLSVPGKEYENTLRKSRYYKDGWKPKVEFRRKIYGNKRLKRAEKGSKGFIDFRSLRRVTKYTFIVKVDAPMFPDASGKPSNASSVKLKMQEGKFVVDSCCVPAPILASFPNTLYEDQEMNCFTKYIFETYDAKGGHTGDVAYNLATCNIAKYLLPVPNAAISPLENILRLTRDSALAGEVFESFGIEDLELFPSRNLWKRGHKKPTNEPNITLMKFPLHKETGEGPYNTYHYNQDDTGNSDAMIKPYAACGFMQVIKAHNKECKSDGCTVMFGDMYHASNWGAHSSHGSGECVDIRPFRKADDNKIGGVFYKSWDKRYDQEKTKDFMKLLIKAGGRPIFFNDPKLIKEFKKADIKKELRPDLGEKWKHDRYPQKPSANDSSHDNHIHVCFPKNDETNDVCKNGLKK